jgi:uracil-DNA glycosylase
LATRDDLLQELRLWPRWTLRSAVGGASAPGTSATAAAPVAAPDPVAAGGDPGDRAARIGALGWGDFAADVDACTACGLCRSRQRSVPGVGDVEADWLFVGEAPGAEEDAQGEPFVGQAGRLLDSMLRALGLVRGANVYIANVLKCRPPNNRTPTVEEVAACRPYLDRQVELIAPRIIVALGKSAANTLLGSDATIGSLRGRVHAYRNVPLVVTYHPAYLLRTLQDKAKAWDDLLLARRTLRSDSGG